MNLKLVGELKTKEIVFKAMGLDGKKIEGKKRHRSFSET